MPYRGMHEVVETIGFLIGAKNAGMSEADRERVVEHVARNPEGGDLVKGSGGARKVRVARQGGGKSGGYRVLTAYLGDDQPVFLLAAYAKNDRSNLTKAQVNEIAELIAMLKAAKREIE